MTTVDPNPHSPHANADPDLRHVFPSPFFFPDPLPGALALTACERMAVVPEENLSEARPGADDLPAGLCPACVAVMNGGDVPDYPLTTCRECSLKTYHDGLCALCRQDAHEKWWPTRDEAVLDASDIELDGGDVMLQELTVGDPIEIEKQTGPLAPGVWVITAFEAEDRSRARVRRLSREEIEARCSGEAFARTYE